jgi:drug/metabolite transporter (DMT)-like permease
MKIALGYIPPLGMRAAATFVGSIALFVIALVARRTLRVRSAKTWRQIFIASLFNIILFSITSSFAQLAATTSRVTILAYTMPIWASLLSGPVLGEYMSKVGWAAFALCCTGLAILIYPLAQSGVPIGILLALCCAWSWSAGTIYMKRVHIEADPFAIAMWQLVIGCIVLSLCAVIFEGGIHIARASPGAIAAVVYTGIFASGLAYFLWFHIIKLLPAMTASLGAQASPVVGVVSSMIVLGERPTATDLVGFGLILAGSVCVLVAPRHAERVQAELP